MSTYSKKEPAYLTGSSAASWPQGTRRRLLQIRDAQQDGKKSRGPKTDFIPYIHASVYTFYINPPPLLPLAETGREKGKREVARLCVCVCVCYMCVCVCVLYVCVCVCVDAGEREA